MTVNRVVALLTALLGVGAAVAPVLADMNWHDTAGVIVGAGLACAAALKWLDGWQKHEARVAAVDPPSVLEPTPRKRAKR